MRPPATDRTSTTIFWESGFNTEALLGANPEAISHLLQSRDKHHRQGFFVIEQANARKLPSFPTAFFNLSAAELAGLCQVTYSSRWHLEELGGFAGAEARAVLQSFHKTSCRLHLTDQSFLCGLIHDILLLLSWVLTQNIPKLFN
jgi:hypothetical protein